MKKVVRILLAILMVATVALTFAACKTDCQKGKHDFALSSVTDATCTTDAVEHYTCNNCTETEDRTVEGSALGHNPSSAWTYANEKHYHACSRCDAHLSEADCSKTPVSGTAAGCGTTGLTDGVQCPVCKHWFTAQTTTNATGQHDYDETIEENVSVTQQATCTTAGAMNVKCANCSSVSTGVVIPATGVHVYAGQSWNKDAATGKHYQTCATCSTARNEHNADYGAWTASADNANEHERTCTVTGCDVKDTAAHTPVTVPGTAAGCATTGLTDGSKCSDCNKVLSQGTVIPATGNHDFANSTKYQSDGVQHWKICANCTAEDTAKTNCEFGDHGVVCEVCSHAKAGIKVVLNVNGEYSAYETLADAIAAAPNNTAVTITLGTLANNKLEGYGIKVENKNIILDLNGNTYVMTGRPVGSTNTETQALQLLKGSVVTIKNGTIAVSETASGAQFLIQNYCNLTLDNVTLDGTNLQQGYNYTLSNNCGTVVINNSTLIAREGGVALDVYYNLNGDYPEGLSVTVDAASTITGVIEYGSAQANVVDLASKATLSLPEGTYTVRFSGNANCLTAGITIGGKRITHSFNEWTNTTKATCEEAGEAKRTCSVCSAEETKMVDALGHSFGEWTQKTAPACTADGVSTRTCSECGKEETKPIAALGHTIEDAQYVGGHKHTGACSVCDFEGEVDCTEGDACEVCGRKFYTYTDKNVTIDTSKQGYTNTAVVTQIKLGDITVDLDKKTNSADPKYYTKGNAVRLYANGTMTISVPDGYTITKITFTFDSDDDGNTVTADKGSYANNIWTGEANSVIFTIGAEKSSGGSGGHRRFQTITVEYTAKLCKHFLTAWQVTTEETCTTDGEKERHCLDCDYVETDVIAAHHTLGTLVEAVDPDCHGTGTDGHVAYYECSVCHKYFKDAQATTEIAAADLTVAWTHTFEVVAEVPADEEHNVNGKQSYNHCTVCDRNYELDGTTEITDLKNWGIILADCLHVNHEWKKVSQADGSYTHVYQCALCGKDQQYQHASMAGVWSVSEGKHVLSCGYTDAQCPFNHDEHDANYADDYTVVEETYHARVCGDCSLYTDKHAAALGDYTATEDKTQHYQACSVDGCNYETEKAAHSATEFAYASNGKHTGECVCGETVEEACTPEGANNACSACGRIVVTYEMQFTLDNKEIGKNKTDTSATSGKRTIFENNDIKIIYDQKSSSSNGNGYDPFRYYANDKFEITAKNGNLTQVIITYDTKAPTDNTKVTVNIGTISAEGTTWNGSAQTVIFTNTNSGQYTVKSFSIKGLASTSCYHDGTLTDCAHAEVGCETVGYDKDCVYCSNCKTYFTDRTCTAISDVAVNPATGHNYGELREHRPGNCVEVPYNMDHYYCDVCRTYFDADKDEVSESSVLGTLDENAHDFGKWTSNDDGTHSRVCANDASHTETADCTLAVEWTYDESMHWHECTVCGEMNEKSWGEHDGMESDGVCDTCGYNNSSVTMTVDIFDQNENTIETGVTVVFSQEQFLVGDTITFTVASDNYEIISVEDYMTSTTLTATDGKYSYTVTGEEDWIVITVCKLVKVSWSQPDNGT
ncbi:MAG: hypothetical protein NC332_01635, partial [Firmicutes bacterium]|nr:hypothetical protein [Bacillota bacterium]